MRVKLQKLLQPGDTEERCGLILTGGKIIKCKNVAEEPDKGFEISADDMVKYEDTAIATWHTHPGEGSNLSLKDRYGFLMWPKLHHYVIGMNSVAEYYIEDGVVYNAD